MVGERMKLVYLLRHAKSAVGDGSEPDHERPLSARGRHAADRIGELLATRDLPDRVLCSSARRTRETLERLQQQLPSKLEISIEPDLYLASSDALLDSIRSLPDDVERVMLVGHNPGIGELAERLARYGPAALRDELGAKFPTGALAIVRISGRRWTAAAAGGTLEAFVRPRELEA